MVTPLNTNDKADTRYLALTVSSIATLATDDGQYATDLSTGATYAYEDSSARTALSESFCIEFEFEYDPGESGIIINHGTSDGVSYTYRIEVDNKGILSFKANGSTIGTLDLDASNLRTYVVFWSLRAEGSTQRSELGAWNTTDSTWTRASEDHSAITTNTGWRLNLGGYGSGTSVYSYGMDTINFVRISARFHSPEEVYLDWIGSTTPDTVTAVRRCGPLPVDSSTTLADHGSFAGPPLLVAGEGNRENDRRLLSPLVNAKISPNNELVVGYLPTTWTRLAIGSANYRWRQDLMFWCPLPCPVNYARVRIHADHYQTGGAGNLPVYLRMYSLDRLPQLNQILNEPPPKPIVSFYCGATINEVSGAAGVGVWKDLGELRIARGNTGLFASTWLLFAWSVNLDAGHIDEASQVLRLNHIVVEPYTKAASGGKFGDYDLQVDA